MEPNDIDENARRLKMAGQLGITCAMLEALENIERQVVSLNNAVAKLLNESEANTCLLCGGKIVNGKCECNE